MKKIDLKMLCITVAVCLLPILAGIFLYSYVPDKIAFHFSADGTPDQFAHKSFTLFGLPCITALLQAFCCIVSDTADSKKRENRKLVRAAKWIIPIITVVLYTATVLYSIGHKIPVRSIACILVGGAMAVIGNYLPKTEPNSFAGVRNRWTKSNHTVWKRVNRTAGIGLVALGILFILSAFLPYPISVAALILLVVFTLFLMLYSAVLAKREN